MRMGRRARHAVRRRRRQNRMRGAHRAAEERRRQSLDPPRRRLAALMDLDFTEEQTMLRDMVRSFCATYAPLDLLRTLEDDPIGFSPETWKQMAALDLIGLMLPPEYGGSGMGAIE